MPSVYEKYYKSLDLDVGVSKLGSKNAWRELSQLYDSGNYTRKSPEVQNMSEEKVNELSNALWTAIIISTARLSVSE